MDFPSTIQVPYSQETQDIVMTLRNGQNTDSTGIRDSQHAPTSQALPRRVYFSSSIKIGATNKEIQGTDSGNFILEQTNTTSSELLPPSKGKGRTT
ncbi:hypothetical protein L873DRAFT_1307088 [Choiromyces venosus 120613-1]|uniref:Uncharacterized protein n=1 Tax=Choiromyces venosus 120613-1 TaxID=1336337 RepID=A0A3N4JE73_9PEZI|nr:hypothetical protein L873DRAFT_1307088 [Choiromyces venosus 120613-1]